MRRMTYIVTALALVLGFSQCKKEQTPANNTTKGVRITLDVDGGASTGPATGGSRAEVDPPHVNFEEGDQILVASNGAYVGTLIHNGSQFVGEITDPEEDEPLYFYFLGNKQGTLEANATSCTVNISDQTTELPVISMGKSTEDYDESVTSYSSRLYNKCSLMKFDVTTPSTAAICITGMNNTVTVDFTDPTDNGFTYGKDGDGVIKMPAKDENTETWAIVLPQDALEEGAEGSVYTDDNAYNGTRPAMDAIEMNKYLADGFDLTVTTAAVTVPDGAISGKFTINANDDQVYFSQGNLQYQASTNTWRFAENQYDYIGSDNSNISQTYSGWIDLFGWGTSGWNCGNTYYSPWDSYNSEGSGYGPQGAYNLTGSYANSDWGYNAISNGGNTTQQWRTLTKDEWVYVFDTRSTSSGIRYAKAQVNGVNGVILLPDDWSTSYYNLNSTNTTNANYSSNVISVSSWTNSLQSHGAVFLPVAGFRSGNGIGSVGTSGFYWSASYFGTGNAYCVRFSGTALTADYNIGRDRGQSVRLACPAEN